MAINLEPVERATVSERIAQKIIDLVNTGELKPGDRLPSERDLMAQLQVSRTPIREALRSLSLIGLLETRPGDGTYVSEHLTSALASQLAWPMVLGRQDVLEWIEVRGLLETHVAGLAAERATPSLIRRLEDALETYHDATEEFERLVGAEIAFHEVIVDMTGNETLKQLMRIFYDVYRQLVRDRRLHFAVGRTFEQGHREILEAIKAGDAEAASQAMTDHLRISKQQALAEEFGEAANPL